MFDKFQAQRRDVTRKTFADLQSPLKDQSLTVLCGEDLEIEQEYFLA